MLKQDVLEAVMPNINEVPYGTVNKVRLLNLKELSDLAERIVDEKDHKLILDYEDALNLLATAVTQNKSISGPCTRSNETIR